MLTCFKWAFHDGSSILAVCIERGFCVAVDASLIPLVDYASGGVSSASY